MSQQWSADRPRPTLLSGIAAMLGVLAAAAIVAILYFGRDIFVPLALAALLSFILVPAVRWLRRRIGRVAAVAFVVFAALVPICGLTAVIGHDIAALTPHLPEYRYNVEHKIQSLSDSVPGGDLFRRAVAFLHKLQNQLPISQRQAAAKSTAAQSQPPVPVIVEQPSPGPLEIMRSVVGPLLRPIALAGLVLIFTIMMLYDWEDLRDRVFQLAGAGDLQRTTDALSDAGQRISRYLSLQLAVNAGYGVLAGIGLTVIGIPNSALWAATTAVLRFIPYLGIWIAALLPLSLAIAVAPGWSLFAWTLLLYLMIELIVANLLEPRLYHHNVGLSSVAVIAAAVFWTWLWGPVGLLLSTPLTLCLIVLGQNVPQLQFLDVILGSEPVLAPQQRFYQRLLAGDPEEVTLQAEEFAEERSLAEFADEVAIPALAIAQADSDRGALSAEGRRALRAGTAAMLENLLDGGEPGEAGARGRAVCVAGRNSLDEAVALLLVHLLRERGRVAVDRALSADVLAPEADGLPALRRADILCLSLISSGSTARARYLVRRLRRRAPKARLLLGLWGWAGEAPPAGDLAAATAADMVALSLREAVEQIEASLNPAFPHTEAAAPS